MEFTEIVKHCLDIMRNCITVLCLWSSINSILKIIVFMVYRNTIESDDIHRVATSVSLLMYMLYITFK